MNVLVFDTETISTNKPFCYNLGYMIMNFDTLDILEYEDFVIEQIYHNKPLFETAYYAQKKPIYTSKLKGKKMTMKKYGHACRKLRTDIKKHGIDFVYAFNSPFDERVLNFNSDFFGVANPLEDVEVRDIRAYAMNTICNTIDYKKFCEQHGLFTESFNYSTNAESLYRFITQDVDFIEEHTALSDSAIETAILYESYKLDSDITVPISAPKSIWRNEEKELSLIVDGKPWKSGHCKKVRVKESKDEIKVFIDTWKGRQGK